MENAPSFVLVIALGPVQEFIATARRCRDLWFGSWLLSELSKAAAASLAAQEGAQALIFPPPSTLEINSSTAIANKVVAVIKGDPKAVADAAKGAAVARLEEIANDVWKRFDEIDLKSARAQVAELLEWNWASACFTEEKNLSFEQIAPAFIEARRRAERLLAARKGCRDFGAVNGWGSARPKSSLDGAREAVVPEAAYRQLNAQQLYERFGVRPGEQLCGVAFLKRHGERSAAGSRIFSTSHVAAQGVLERWNRLYATPLARRDAESRVSDFERDLRERLQLGPKALGNVPEPLEDPIFGQLDGHLLFPNRLAEFFVAPRTSDRDKNRAARLGAREAGEHAGESLKTLLKGLGGKSPSPYYAVLLADGDFMGAAIQNADNRERNQFLSGQLALFAGDAGQIVTRHRGSLIYAGGDDVLALLPLHSCLQAARELASAFNNKFQDPRFNGWLDKRPTLSVGLAVVHHLEPLSEALSHARRAEKAAKDVDNVRGKKNALAVLVDKRGGAPILVADHWSQSEGRFDGLDGRLSAFARWLRAGVISRSLLSDWAELARRLEPPVGSNWDAAQWDAVSEEWEIEALWLARRKRESGGGERVREAILGALERLLHEARGRDPHSSWLGALVSEMLVAHEYAVARDIALSPETQEATPEELPIHD